MNRVHEALDTNVDWITVGVGVFIAVVLHFLWNLRK